MIKAMTTLNELRIECFRCSKLLVHPDQNKGTEIVGVFLEGSGSYGSTFDYSETFTIAVCDDCLNAAIEEKNKIVVIKKSKPTVSYNPVKTSSDLHSGY